MWAAKVSTEMASLLTESFNKKLPGITQQTGRITSRDMDRVDQLLLIVPPKQDAALWRKIPQGSRIKDLVRTRAAQSVPAGTTRLNNRRQTRIVLAIAPKNADTFEQLTFARKIVATTSEEKPGAVGILVIGFDDATQKEIVLTVTAAALAAAFVMPEFKSKATPSPMRSIRIFGLKDRVDLSRTVAEASGNNLVRWLTAMPSNKLDAAAYIELTKELAGENGWQFRKYGIRELQKLGAGAFLAVAQGNDNESAAILHIKYRPGKKTANAAVSLVGKGIIFDTGGTNLKPFNSMLDMHIDMGGSAVALSTLKTISDLGLPFAVDCWLAITENRSGPNAYKSQDILTAANGKTIQTIHTDAEGRLVLADTLVLASREKPALIIDYATLTGACITGISDRFSGVFSNRAKLHPILKRAGRKSGERVWPFPIGDEFVAGLKSEIADLVQCRASGSGDHIYAASFLGEFVDKKIPWVHVDLSACTHKGGLAHVPSNVTGFGVRFTMNLLLDQKILGASQG
jgi:leucyl aminopeptidase